MKNILLINNGYPSTFNIRHSTYVKSIYDGLIEAGFEVDKIVLEIIGNSIFSKVKSYIKFYYKLFVYDYSNYEYVYIHHFPFVFFPLILKFKGMSRVVINWHGNDVDYNRTINKYLNRLSYLFIKPSFKHIVPSNYFKDLLLKKVQKINSNDVFVSPSGGVDVSRFNKRNNLDNYNKIIVGFASGLSKNKGVAELINLVYKLDKDKYDFHIINYGKDSSCFIESVESFSNIFFYDVLDKENMPDFYNGIDLLFFPTKKESLGLVALEAMSCNIPVIGPDDFALKSIIIPGVTGEKYDANIKDSYLKCFTKFVEGRRSYNPRILIIDKFSTEKVSEQYKEIFI